MLPNQVLQWLSYKLVQCVHSRLVRQLTAGSRVATDGGGDQRSSAAQISDAEVVGTTVDIIIPGGGENIACSLFGQKGEYLGKFVRVYSGEN